MLGHLRAAQTGALAQPVQKMPSNGAPLGDVARHPCSKQQSGSIAQMAGLATSAQRGPLRSQINLEGGSKSGTTAGDYLGEGDLRRWGGGESGGHDNSGAARRPTGRGAPTTQRMLSTSRPRAATSVATSTPLGCCLNLSSACGGPPSPSQVASQVARRTPQ